MREIIMTKRDLKKVEILTLISKNKMLMKQGARELGLTKRHLRRLRRRYEREGPGGVPHRLRGRPGNNTYSDELRRAMIKLLHEEYPDFGPTLAAEKISEKLGQKVSRERIRQIQIKEKLWKPKREKERRYYPRRPRRSRRGELIQIDGSEHDWLEGRGERCTLIAFIDDATSETLIARFAHRETTENYIQITKEYIDRYGVPKALYSDKHSIFRQNLGERHLQGKRTHFGESLQKLDIELICANSPQAKGRIERSFGTHQDRLVKELRLAKIDTMEEANIFLEGYLKKHNRQFSVSPAETENAHRKLPKEIDLKQTFSRKEYRTLSKGLSFQYKNTLYQINKPNSHNRLKNQKIQIIDSLDGKLTAVTLRGDPLEILPYCEYTDAQRTVGSKEIGTLWKEKKSKKTPKRHPWR